MYSVTVCCVKKNFTVGAFCCLRFFLAYEIANKILLYSLDLNGFLFPVGRTRNMVFSFHFTAGRSERVQMKNDLAKINKVITEHTNHLAPYQFLTAFSQLISRICHSHDEVFAVLMVIVAKVFLAYPQQAMWMMTAVSKVA